MLEVVRFELHNHYGLRNSMTGIVLCHEGGNPRLFRTKWGARRKARRFERSFNKAIRNINMSFEKETHDG